MHPAQPCFVRLGRVHNNLALGPIQWKVDFYSMQIIDHLQYICYLQRPHQQISYSSYFVRLETKSLKRFPLLRFCLSRRHYPQATTSCPLYKQCHLPGVSQSSPSLQPVKSSVQHVAPRAQGTLQASSWPPVPFPLLCLDQEQEAVGKGCWPECPDHRCSPILNDLANLLHDALRLCQPQPVLLHTPWIQRPGPYGSLFKELLQDFLLYRNHPLADLCCLQPLSVL